MCSVFALSPSLALAQEDADETNYKPKSERRDGFTVGLSYGLGVGSYVGYPNEVEKMNNPEYRADTGAALASGYSIWLGGALRDWFTFGVGLSSAGAQGNDTTAGAGAIGVHLETFPLWPMGGTWRDLGVVTEFGAGGGLLSDSDGNEIGNGGNMAFVGAGLIYEPWQFWHMSHGPALVYKYEFSDSMTASTVLLGWRMAFYWTQQG